MFEIGGSALDAAKPASERLADAQRQVWKAEKQIKAWQDELDKARNELVKLDVWPRPEGWY